MPLAKTHLSNDASEPVARAVEDVLEARVRRRRDVLRLRGTRGECGRRTRGDDGRRRAPARAPQQLLHLLVPSRGLVLPETIQKCGRMPAEVARSRVGPWRAVAVLGGGVAGLSAAHELAERGFDVTVYEARDLLGGKARSMPVPGSGTDGRARPPAEHGFRFFPGFYRHLPDTMRRIPFAGQRRRRRRQPRRPRRARCSPRPAGATSCIGAAHAPGARSTTSRRSAASCATGRRRSGIPPHEHALLRRAAADAADELRRAAPRAVGAPELVGVQRRRAAQRGVREVPRRRAHAHARRGAARGR